MVSSVETTCQSATASPEKFAGDKKKSVNATLPFMLLLQGWFQKVSGDTKCPSDAATPEKVAVEALSLAVTSKDFLKQSVNAVLPLGGLAIIAYWFASSKGNDLVQEFLVLVVVQLLPMAVLKLKTWISSSRVNLMPAALVKSLMLHIAAQLFRTLHHLYGCYEPLFELYDVASYGTYGWLQVVFDCGTCIVAMHIVMLEFGFKFEGLRAFVKEHNDVVTCLVGGCLMAVTVHIVAPPHEANTFMEICAGIANMFIEVANNLEILAFVPVARIVCLESGSAVQEYTPKESVSTLDRRKSVVFLAFILAYYFWEDIIFTILMEQHEVLVPKMAHFMILMDFTFYFVLQVGAQPQILGDILLSILQKGDTEMLVSEQHKKQSSISKEVEVEEP